MDKLYPAHIRITEAAITNQTVREHCKAAGTFAGESLSEIGLKSTGYVAGILHDLGKAKEEFREYLERAAGEPESVKRGSVNHTFAGVRYALENLTSAELSDYASYTAEILAYAIGAHHGLFDCITEDHKSGFKYRLEKEGIGYSEAVQNYLAECFSSQEVQAAFESACAEIAQVLEKTEALLDEADDERNITETAFYDGLLARLVLSAVIDGDRCDTAEFMSQCAYPQKLPVSERQAVWRRNLSYMEEKLKVLNASNLQRSVNKKLIQARQAISDQCAAFAENPGGIYRLNVPTGAGKTLSGLRYALTHAAKWKKSRIILTSSLLSVLDQNAAVIRDYLPDQNSILEHHSNVVRPKDEEELAQWEMLTEQWSAPVVITTQVQLLNTLFSGKTSCIRRFHSLANSVLVLDEVQTVPTNMLTLFNLAVNFLAKVCNTTVVLCTATQPALEKADHPLYCTPQDIVPYQKEIWDVFRRTEIKDGGTLCLEEIPAFAMDVLEGTDSLLVVCNKKKEAAYLYEALSQPEVRCFHLSASMCMAHRKETLMDIQQALQDPAQKVVCISTQVIEAGVDISFGSVIRFAAGMDSVVQAAGRCNRNGESITPAPVYIVNCIDEKLGMLQEIDRGKKATIGLLYFYRQNPERFGCDLSSDSSIRRYYSRLYQNMNDNHQDMVDSKTGRSIFELLSTNYTFAQNTDYPYLLKGAFKTAGDAFEVFDQNTKDVLVSYGDGVGIISRLFAMERSGHVDFSEMDKLVRQAKQYSVSLYPYQADKMEQNGALTALFGGRITVLSGGFYDEKKGFTMEPTFLEV